MRRVNWKRRKKRQDEGLVYGPYHQWIATKPCILSGVREHKCIGDVVGHHIRSVGAGGQDYGNEIPVCALAHLSIETLGRLTFCRRWCVSVTAEVKALKQEWDDNADPDYEL